MAIEKREYPIIEFDDSAEAIIEPRNICRPIDIAEHCVICFFNDVITKAVEDFRAKTVWESRWECGLHKIYEIAYNTRPVALFHPRVGAPMAAALLEEAIALGCRKFIVVGGAGVLDKNIAPGNIIVPYAAIRDEGTSYHYLPPGREVSASSEAVTAIEKTLKEHNIEYLISKTWTTDAVFRETPGRVRMRKEDGCLTVEMEAAAFFAVAKFRKIILGQMLYGGDDVSGEEWDGRKGEWQIPVRERMFWLAVEACLKL
jgi:uridine phosphorylase